MFNTNICTWFSGSYLLWYIVLYQLTVHCFYRENFSVQLEIQIILTGADRHPDKGLHTYQQYLDHLWQVRHHDTDLHHYQHSLYMDHLWQVRKSTASAVDDRYTWTCTCKHIHFMTCHMLCNKLALGCFSNIY